MDQGHILQEVYRLRKTRKLLGIFLSVFIGLTCLLCFRLIVTKERIILLPSRIATPLVFDQSFSIQYLEEMSLYFSNFFLNKTSENCAYFHRVLLDHVDLERQAAVKELLDREASIYKDTKLRTVFTPLGTKVHPGELSVIVEGTYRQYVDKECVREDPMKVTWWFQEGVGGRLFIKKVIKE